MEPLLWKNPAKTAPREDIIVKVIGRKRPVISKNYFPSFQVLEAYRADTGNGNIEWIDSTNGSILEVIAWFPSILCDKFVANSCRKLDGNSAHLLFDHFPDDATIEFASIEETNTGNYGSEDDATLDFLEVAKMAYKLHMRANISSNGKIEVFYDAFNGLPAELLEKLTSTPVCTIEGNTCRIDERQIPIHPNKANISDTLKQALNVRAVNAKLIDNKVNFIPNFWNHQPTAEPD